jgi:hypothetical protein
MLDYLVEGNSQLHYIDILMQMIITQLLKYNSTLYKFKSTRIILLYLFSFIILVVVFIILEKCQSQFLLESILHHCPSSKNKNSSISFSSFKQIKMENKKKIIYSLLLFSTHNLIHIPSSLLLRHIKKFIIQ